MEAPEEDEIPTELFKVTSESRSSNNSTSANINKSEAKLKTAWDINWKRRMQENTPIIIPHTSKVLLKISQNRKILN